jgi:hypothetical protein
MIGAEEIKRHRRDFLLDVADRTVIRISSAPA